MTLLCQARNDWQLQTTWSPCDSILGRFSFESLYTICKEEPISVCRNSNIKTWALHYLPSTSPMLAHAWWFWLEEKSPKEYAGNLIVQTRSLGCYSNKAFIWERCVQAFQLLEYLPNFGFCATMLTFHWQWLPMDKSWEWQEVRGGSQFFVFFAGPWPGVQSFAAAAKTEQKCNLNRRIWEIHGSDVKMIILWLMTLAESQYNCSAYKSLPTYFIDTRNTHVTIHNTNTHSINMWSEFRLKSHLPSRNIVTYSIADKTH
jgi:hypothetical protein